MSSEAFDIFIKHFTDIFTDIWLENVTFGMHCSYSRNAIVLLIFLLAHLYAAKVQTVIFSPNSSNILQKFNQLVTKMKCIRLIKNLNMRYLHNINNLII